MHAITFKTIVYELWRSPESSWLVGEWGHPNPRSHCPLMP